MIALENLEELEGYLHKVMPQWRSVSRLTRNSNAGFIDFQWHGHHFAVKPSLETFEIKDNKLYVTAGSLLLQAALSNRTSAEFKVSEIVDGLDRAIDAVKAQPDDALSLVGVVKHTLHKMVASNASAARRTATASSSK